jgi:flagellar basal body-associated protein FliL
MTWRGSRGSTSTWIALALAITTLLAVVVVIAEFWSGIGDSEISLAGWFAMGLGIIVTLALGIGLMSLVFFSSRGGYDETSRRDS